MYTITITHQDAELAIYCAYMRSIWGADATRKHVAKHGPSAMALYRLACQLAAVTKPQAREMLTGMSPTRKQREKLTQPR